MKMFRYKIMMNRLESWERNGLRFEMKRLRLVDIPSGKQTTYWHNVNFVLLTYLLTSCAIVIAKSA